MFPGIGIDKDLGQLGGSMTTGLRNGLKMISTLLLTLLGGYTLLLALVYLGQDGLLYFPDKTLVASPADMGLAYEEVWLETQDGESLHAWHVPADPARGSVLFLHGNAGNISHRLDSIHIFHGLGLEVLIPDYRGYGRSSGRPSEQGTYLDALAAWRWLSENRGIPPGRILLFGRSLGAAVAVDLATRVPAAGLMIESAFTSVPDLATELYPILPVRQLSRYRYDNMAKISGLGMPLLLAHSPQDEIVPYHHGRRLFSAATASKQFLQMRGGHNDGFLRTGTDYTLQIQAFLDKVLPLSGA